MKDVILLTKILFKSSLANSKNFKKGFGKIVLFGMLYLYLASIVGYISYQSINSLLIFGQEKIFLNLSFICATIFTIFQTIFTSMNILFFSKDIEALLPLPIKPYKIIMSKFNCLILSQYIMYSILIVPILLVYGILTKALYSYYLLSILVIILLPIIPVVVTCFLVMIIMKFTNIIKNKEVVQYLTVAITIIFVIAIQFFMSNTSGDITNVELANNLIESNIKLQKMQDILINTKPAIEIMVNHSNIKSIINLGLLIIETISIYVIISFISSKIYTKTVKRVTSNGIKKNKKTNLEKNIRRQNIRDSYIKKEFIGLNRNPIFFMQCVLPSLIFPLIFILPIIFSITGENGEDFIELRNLISNSINTNMGICISLITIDILFIFNFISITSISRDGNNSNFMKYIPISYEKQCLYKIMPGILLNIFPIAYVIIFLKIFTVVRIKMLLYLIIISMLINTLNNFVMIIIDLKNPKLDWMTEYAVVKQNLNMLFQAIIIMFEIGIMVAIFNIFSNIDIITIVIVLLLTLSIIGVKRYIKNNSIKLFKKIL